MHRQWASGMLAGALVLAGAAGAPSRAWCQSAGTHPRSRQPSAAQASAAQASAPQSSGTPPSSLDPAPDGNTAAARKAHVAGLEAREQGDFHGALARFAEAWRHKHHWEIAVNLGEAEMRTGHYEDAVRHLTFAMSERGFLDRSPDLVDEESARVRGWLSEALGHLRNGAASPPAASSGGAPTSTAPTAAAGQGLSPAWMAGVGAGSGAAVLAILTASLTHGMATAQLRGVQSSLAKLPGDAGDPASIRCAGAAAQAVCDENVGRLRAADELQTGGNLALVAAGALAAGTVVFAIFGPQRVVVAPAGDGKVAGLVLSGAF